MSLRPYLFYLTINFKTNYIINFNLLISNKHLKMFPPATNPTNTFYLYHINLSKAPLKLTPYIAAAGTEYTAIVDALKGMHSLKSSRVLNLEFYLSSTSFEDFPENTIANLRFR